MVEFKLVKVTMPVEISPRFLPDLESAVARTLTSKLLVYSHKVGGVPLSFSIESIAHTGVISSSKGDIALDVSADHVVLVIPFGGVMSSLEGRALSIFSTDIDGNKEYTGDFVPKGIELRGEAFFTITGTPL